MAEGDYFDELAQCAMHHAIAYRSEGELVPPRPLATLDELRNSFAVGIPARGRRGVDVLEDLAAAAGPGLVGNIRPDFFAWVMGASHPVGVAADWLTAAWGQNAGIYATAPAAAVAEEVVSDWLLDLLALPPESSVGFSTGATMASSICLSAARSEVLRRAGYDLEREGMFSAPAITIYLGEEAHTTILSGLRYLGFGDRNLVKIAVDSQGRMLPDALEHELARREGPAIVICQAGHICSGDIDPVGKLAAIAHSHGAWCHVDGAFGLWARAVPGLAHLCEGIDSADSWSVDGHKWLQLPYDSGFAIVRHPQAHQRAMDISASYIATAPGDGRSPSQFCPELSRRARGFAAWAVIQALGREGIEEMISRHCHCARQLRDRLAAEPGIAILNEVVLNQLAIGFGDAQAPDYCDQLTDAVIAELARENSCFVEGAQWKGRRILRVSVISRLTDSEDIERLGTSIIRAWRLVAGRPL